MARGFEKYFDAERGPDLRRRPRDGQRRTWQVSQLWDNHREMARRIALGQKNNQIAVALGVTPTCVSLARNSPVVQEHVQVLQGTRDADTMDITRSIKLLAPKALKVLEDIVCGRIGDAGPVLQAKVSMDVLDRAGHAAVRTLTTTNLHAHLTADDIAAMKQRAIAAGAVIDV